MSATDELRRMLDERGIEYSMREDSWAKETYWIVNHNPYRFSERSEYGTCVLHNITPEQAIAATPGCGECENVGEPGDFCCSECGARLYTEMSDGYTMIECDKKTIIKLPRYCPNCGKAVKR